MQLKHKGRFLSFYERNNYEFVSRGEDIKVAGIIPITRDHKIVLIEEYREPMEKKVIGIPAGLVGDEGKESLEDGAKRELLEETGYKANKMRLVGNFSLSSGLTDEVMTVFIATELDKITNKVGVEGESITVIELPIFSASHKIMQLENDETMIDFKAFLAVYFGVEEIHRRIAVGELKLSSQFGITETYQNKSL